MSLRISSTAFIVTLTIGSLPSSSCKDLKRMTPVVACSKTGPARPRCWLLAYGSQPTDGDPVSTFSYTTSGDANPSVLDRGQ